jgi:hypothetical protein
VFRLKEKLLTEREWEGYFPTREALLPGATDVLTSTAMGIEGVSGRASLRWVHLAPMFHASDGPMTWF